MNSIFHAFNLEYKQIEEIVPKLVALGFSHVQFPPIQTTRTLSSTDTNFLKHQIHLMWHQLEGFEKLCKAAKQKNTCYSLHTFDHLLKHRSSYIRQPLLRDMYSYIFSGIHFQNILSFLYSKPEYQTIFAKDKSIPPFQVAYAKECVERHIQQEYMKYPPWWLIYQPTELKIGNTFLGSKEDIVNAIKVCKEAGLSVIADIIINNVASIFGEKDVWLPYVQSNAVTLQDVYDSSPLFETVRGFLRNTFGSDDLSMITAPRECRYGTNPTQCWMYGSMPQLNQDHPLIRQHVCMFLQELKDIGIDGVRVDAAAHLSPDVCRFVLSQFSGLSYVEYVGGTECWRRYKSYEYNMCCEDFTIGNDLSNFVFGPPCQINRLDSKSPRLQHGYLNSVVLVANHDHFMETIPSNMYTQLPSQYTYEASMAYLLQRIHGSVLLMPHDIQFMMIQKALHLRKQMRSAGIVREYVTVNNIISIEKYSNDKRMFIVQMNPTNSFVTTEYGVLGPYSFSIFYV
jgi:hypothetical protein